MVKMIKRIVVAGCRDFNDYNIAKRYISNCISRIKNDYELVFVSGGCRGADMLGERFANENGYKIERHIANWEVYLSIQTRTGFWNKNFPLWLR